MTIVSITKSVEVEVEVDLFEVMKEAGHFACRRAYADLFSTAMPYSRFYEKEIEHQYYAEIAAGGQQSASQSLRDFYWHTLGRIL